MSADSCIHCAERIVQEVDVCVLIHGSRKRRETSEDDTSHSLGLISESWWCPTTPGSFQRVHGKNQDPASYRPTQWARSVCSWPLGAVEGEGEDGNWNPIYLARLTRAFCPSLSGVPLSPITVWSPSSRNCKSYVEIEKGKRINLFIFVVVVENSFFFLLFSKFKNL